jgi:FkbM family methyltransferase
MKLPNIPGYQVTEDHVLGLGNPIEIEIPPPTSPRRAAFSRSRIRSHFPMSLQLAIMNFCQRGGTSIMYTIAFSRKRAAWNLGIPSLVRLQLQRRFGTSRLCKLTSRRLKHPVYVRRDTTDVAVFMQIFIDREYRCLDHVRSPSLVIDCGANVGYSSAYFLSRFPDCTVMAVEPDPENFTMLCDNVRPYGTRCRPIRAAVWSQQEKLRLNQNGEAWATKVESAEDGDVATVTIPELLGLSCRPRISILKIDIESAEYEIFRSSPEWLDQVDNIVIELHDTPCREAFFAAIAGRGFEIGTCDELTVCRKHLPQ